MRRVRVPNAQKRLSSMITRNVSKMLHNSESLHHRKTHGKLKNALCTRTRRKIWIYEADLTITTCSRSKPSRLGKKQVDLNNYCFGDRVTVTIMR